jgi:hypothetical protein
VCVLTLTNEAQTSKAVLCIQDVARMLSLENKRIFLRLDLQEPLACLHEGLKGGDLVPDTVFGRVRLG